MNKIEKYGRHILGLILIFFLSIKTYYLFELVEVDGAIFLTTQGWIISLLMYIFLFIPLLYLPKKHFNWLFTFLLIGTSALFIADAWYFRYFKDFLSFSLIFQAGQLGDVKESVFSVIKWTDILYFMDIWLLLLLRKYSLPAVSFKNINSYVWLFMIYSMMAFTFYYSAFQLSNVEKRNTNVISSCFIGVLPFHIFESTLAIRDYVVPVKISEKEKLALEEIKKEDTLPNETFGIFKGKNLLFIQWESLSKFPLGLRVEGQEITPNLNKWRAKSFEATNFWNQVAGGHSSDTEMMAIHSIYPFSNKSINMIYANQHYNSFIHKLKEVGYQTGSIHAYDKEFWNRVNMHPSLGFNESLFIDEFSNKDEMRWGYSDKTLYDETLIRLSEKEEPFATYMITLQNHHPYESKEQHLDLSSIKNDTIEIYFHSLYETDKAFGEFMVELEKKDWFKDTVIVLYGDHDGEFSKEELNEYTGKELSAKELLFYEQVPFLLIDGSGEWKGQYSNPMGQMDIAPTLSHLFGIKTKGSYYFGQNIFDESNEKVMLSPSNWMVTDRYFYSSKENSPKAWDVNTLEDIPITEEMRKLYSEKQSDIQLANRMIESNYLDNDKNHVIN